VVATLISSLFAVPVHNLNVFIAGFSAVCVCIYLKGSLLQRLLPFWQTASPPQWALRAFGGHLF
jgi:hypothetical protein